MTFARKVYLQLPVPSPADLRADRERVLEAFHADSMTLSAMQTLYPTLKKANYAVTASLSPTDTGWEIRNIEAGDTRSRSCALALDLGSTTLEMELVDMVSGQVLGNAGCVNSQVSFGLNILDRILAVKEDRENLSKLRSLILGDIERLADELCTRVGRESVSALVIGGNTTMIHFFLGCDPWLVFQNPYAPVFFDPGIVSARQVGLDLSCNVFCFPAVANYLGGDITAGLLLTDLDTTDKPSVFLDIGTNGELCLGCKEYLLMGAGAAGPALEGFGSRYGMRAEKGAIRHLRMGEDGNFQLDVIGGGVPKGICGTGIFDLVAECYRAGIIHGDGTVNMEDPRYVTWIWDEDIQESLPAVVYGRNGEEKLYFTQRDIQEFVRCKAAGFTMVATLLDYCGLSLADVGKFYLAGGFGTHIDLESAITVGLYPDVDRAKLVPLGNTSLQGAKKLLLDTACLERLTWFRKNGTYLHFSEMETFPQNMVAANFIPHTDSSLYPSVKRRV